MLPSEDFKGACQLISSLVASEEITDLCSSKSARCLTEGIENLVGDRVAKAVPEDVARRRLAVVPDSEGSLLVLGTD